MVANGHGSIVNISSMADDRPERRRCVRGRQGGAVVDDPGMGCGVQPEGSARSTLPPARSHTRPEARSASLPLVPPRSSTAPPTPMRSPRLSASSPPPSELRDGSDRRSRRWPHRDLTHIIGPGSTASARSHHQQRLADVPGCCVLQTCHPQCPAAQFGSGPEDADRRHALHFGGARFSALSRPETGSATSGEPSIPVAG
jgi:hypothetical protein